MHETTTTNDNTKPTGPEVTLEIASLAEMHRAPQAQLERDLGVVTDCFIQVTGELNCLDDAYAAATADLRALRYARKDIAMAAAGDHESYRDRLFADPELRRLNEVTEELARRRRKLSSLREAISHALSALNMVLRLRLARAEAETNP